MERTTPDLEKIERQGRIYMRYRPNAQSLDKLADLQSKLELLYPQATPVPIDKIHLTFLHFGNFHDVFEELSAFNPGLELDEYGADLYDFIRTVEEKMPQKTVVQPRSLQLFGPHEDVLGISLHADTKLMRAQESACTMLVGFLQRCGLEEIDRVMEASPNFRYNSTYQPHISLLRDAPQLPDIQLPRGPLVFEVDRLVAKA